MLSDDTFTKLALLVEGLNRGISLTGEGKHIPSAFSYLGEIPTTAWIDACDDPMYRMIKESIESFMERWRTLIGQNYTKWHYVSLGPGTGHKDLNILSCLYPIHPSLFYIPVDMSAQMLVRAIQEVLQGILLERHRVAPMELDFSNKEGVEVLLSHVGSLVGEEPVLFSLLGNTLANFEQDLDTLKLLSTLLRPQDRLLLELATTQTLSQETAQMAASEYSGSQSFREFARSSVLQNTNLRIGNEDITFLGTVEASRAIRIAAIYQNTAAIPLKIVLPDHTMVNFPPKDTIRLFLTRKYTNEGIEGLIAPCGLSLLEKQGSVFTPASGLPFSTALLLLAPSEKKRD